MGWNSGTHLFFGGLGSVEQAWLVASLAKLRASGYRRLVEPCSGLLACSRSAAHAGFPEAEASDVNIIPCAVGELCAGRDLDGLGVRWDGEPVSDPGELFYHLQAELLETGSGTNYGARLLEDFESNREAYEEKVRDAIDGCRSSLPGRFAFHPLDMAEQLEESKGDCHTVIALWAPTIGGDYTKNEERWSGHLEWDAPAFEEVDPATVLESTMRSVGRDGALLLMGVERPEQPEGSVFSCRSGRAGMRRYWVCNRPDEWDALIGRSIARSTRIEPEGRRWSLRTRDVGPDTELSVAMLSGEESAHYVALLRKRFDGAERGSKTQALLADGELVGVFSYMDINMQLGQADHATHNFALAVPGHRFARLLTMVSAQVEQLERFYDDYQMGCIMGAEDGPSLSTVTFTDKPMSMEMRGIGKARESHIDQKTGLRCITYDMPVTDMSLEEVRDEFLEQQRPKRRRGRRGHDRPRRRDDLGEGRPEQSA